MDKCKIGCGRDRVAQDMCNTHYRRWKRTGDPGPVEIRTRGLADSCSIDDCDGPVYGLGWCNKHWQRWRKTGDPLGVRPNVANRTSFQPGQTPYNMGIPCPDEVRARISATCLALGRVPWNKGRPWSHEHIERHLRGRRRSEATRARIRAARARQVVTPAHRAAIAAGLHGRPKSPAHVANLTGPRNHRWRGGTIARNLSRKAWRTVRGLTLARDGYRCRRCGLDDRRQLVAHHVIEYRDGGPDSLDNLETLCRACHVAHHSRRRAVRRQLVHLDLNHQVGPHHA